MSSESSDRRDREAAIWEMIESDADERPRTIERHRANIVTHEVMVRRRAQRLAELKQHEDLLAEVVDATIGKCVEVEEAVEHELEATARVVESLPAARAAIVAIAEEQKAKLVIADFVASRRSRSAA